MDVGRMEFLYDQAPESMRSSAAALYWLTMSAGSYMGTLLVITRGDQRGRTMASGQPQQREAGSVLLVAGDMYLRGDNESDVESNSGCSGASAHFYGGDCEVACERYGSDGFTLWM
jgi:hypothetical protein